MKFFFLPLLSLVFPAVALAQSGASLYFTPIAGSAATGQELVVRVMLNTAGQEVNAADGKIIFDPKALAVERIEADDSIFRSWATAPRYDNEAGEVVFGGSLPATTTYSGERGEILRIVFRGLRTGETRLRFDTGSAILAGDGTGGNILAETKVGVYVFSPTESAPPESAEPQTTSEGEVLGAETSAIVSSTHPDESAWSRERTGVFRWSNSPSVVRVLTGVSTRSGARGVRAFVPPISERTVTDLPEGVSYFSVTQEFADGTERTMEYRLMIDATPPSVFDVRADDRRDETDPNVRFSITATDTLSGIERIDFSLDDGPPTPWRELSERSYALSGIAFGDHVLHAIAYDRAGNSVERTVSFSVKPLPAPKFTIVSKEISEGDRIRASVSATPGTTLRVYITPDGDETFVESAEISAEGTAEFTSTSPVRPGVYRVSADIVDARGATSDRVAEEVITVKTSILGMVSRHPLVVVAGFGALVCLIALVFGTKWFFQNRDSLKEHAVGTTATSPLSSHPTQEISGAHLHIPDGPVHMERQKNFRSDTRGAHSADRTRVNAQGAASAPARPLMDRGVIDLRPLHR